MILPLFEFYHAKCGRIHSKVSGTERKILPDPNNGVFFYLTKAAEITIKQLLKIVPPEAVCGDLTLQIKFGFDGSGGHALYNQANQDPTNNINVCSLKTTQCCK